MRDESSTHADGRTLVRTKHPGIYKRGSRFVVVWQHRGKQHKSFHRTLGEAKEAQGLRRQPGYRRPASQRLFGDYAAEWLRDYQGRTAKGLAQSTRAAYKRDMEARIIPFFGRYRLGDIGAPEIRAFVKKLEDEPRAAKTDPLAPETDPLAATSIRKVVAPLRALFATAVEDRAVPFNPTQGIRVARADRTAQSPRQNAIPTTQLRRLLRKLPTRERLLCHLLATTGLRISEALGLDWEDVDLGATPQLHVRRQYYRGELKDLKTTTSRRTLPLGADVARRLRRAKKGRASGPVFCTLAGRRLSDRNVRRALDRASAKAGTPRITLHAFRHTFGSRLYNDCKDLRKVSAWLGHADPAFTLRTYVHLVDAELGAAPSWGLGKAA